MPFEQQGNEDAQFRARPMAQYAPSALHGLIEQWQSRLEIAVRSLALAYPKRSSGTIVSMAFRRCFDDEKKILTAMCIEFEDRHTSYEAAEELRTLLRPYLAYLIGR